jgi:hypothetical protein
VDECAGDKTPFPYNRVDTKGNPIFSIICIIINIIVLVISIINKFIIPVINGIISVFNFYLKNFVALKYLEQEFSVLLVN